MVHQRAGLSALNDMEQDELDEAISVSYTHLVEEKYILPLLLAILKNKALD